LSSSASSRTHRFLPAIPATSILYSLGNHSCSPLRDAAGRLVSSTSQGYPISFLFHSAFPLPHARITRIAREAWHSARPRRAPRRRSKTEEEEEEEVRRRAGLEGPISTTPEDKKETEGVSRKSNGKLGKRIFRMTTAVGWARTRQVCVLEHGLRASCMYGSRRGGDHGKEL
jgi:hypothetical protein